MQTYERLEQELVKWSGMPYVVACSSGTAALHLAFEVLRPQEDKPLVAMADFNMIAGPRAARMAGLWPLLIDCQDDLTTDGRNMLEGMNSHESYCDGCLVTHVYGRWAQAVKRVEPVPERGFLIEDMAELHEQRPSLMTDAACWSFYKNKVVAGEEGGAVGFRLKHHADKARQLRSLGFTEAHDFTHVPRGHNYRLSNVHAELILRSLDQFENNVRARRIRERWYNELIPKQYHMPLRLSPWVYDLRIRGMTQTQQDALVKYLRGAGIEARHAFKPIHQQEEFRGCTVIGSGNAEVLSREVIYLPLGPVVTHSAVNRATEDIKLFCRTQKL